MLNLVESHQVTYAADLFWKRRIVKQYEQVQPESYLILVCVRVCVCVRVHVRVEGLWCQ